MFIMIRILWIFAFMMIIPALPFLILLRLIFYLEERFKMKKTILNSLLSVSVFLAGCAGREANPMEERKKAEEVLKKQEGAEYF